MTEFSFFGGKKAIRVKLLTGGPEMVALAPTGYDGVRSRTHVECIWFDIYSGEIKEKSLPADALMLVE